MTSEDARRAMDEALARSHAIDAVLVLAQTPGIGPTRLWHAVGTGNMNTTKRLVTHLQKQGLARQEKRAGKGDKPAYALTLTPKGKRVAAALANVAKHFEPGT